MASFQNPISRIGRAAANFVWNAASSLLGGAEKKAEELSAHEMEARVDEAASALGGIDTGRVNTRDPLAVGEALLGSFQYDEKKKRTSCVIPAGVSLEQAILATYAYARAYPDKIATSTHRDGHAFVKPEAEAKLAAIQKWRGQFPEYCQKDAVSQGRELVVVDSDSPCQAERRASDVLEVILHATLSACSRGQGNVHKFLTSEFNCAGLLNGDISIEPGKFTPDRTSYTLLRTATQLRREKIAEEMVRSYNYSKGVSSFTIPAGVSDSEALVALKEYVHLHQGESDWSGAGIKARDYSKSRHILVELEVNGTLGHARDSQEKILRAKGLQFADPRDQLMALVLHRYEKASPEFLKDRVLRGSVPGFALDPHRFRGVVVSWYFGDVGNGVIVAASGSPSPE